MSTNDIFTYSTINDNIATDSESLNYFASKNIPTSTSDLNNILNLTTLKRACCAIGNGDSVIVDVKLPFTANDTYDNAPNIAALEKKFGYKNHQVEITKDLCNNPNIANIINYNTTNTEGYTNCDNFYEVYCKNVLADYMNQTGGKYNLDEFVDYAKDCSCYVPKPEIYKQFNLPPKCYIDTCDPTIAYLDSRSRTTPSCQTTICQDNVNIGKVVVGEHSSVNFNSEIACNQEATNNSATETSPNKSSTGTISPTNSTNTSETTNNNKTIIYAGIGIIGSIMCLLIIGLVIVFFMVVMKILLTNNL